MRRVECLERARASGDRRASRVRDSTASARRKSVTKRESGRGRETGVRDILVALLSSADMAARAASSHHMLALFLRGRGGPGARKRVACVEEWHADPRERAFISVVLIRPRPLDRSEGSGDERTSNHLEFSRERFGRSIKYNYFDTMYPHVVFVKRSGGLELSGSSIPALFLASHWSPAVPRTRKRRMCAGGRLFHHVQRTTTCTASAPPSRTNRGTRPGARTAREGSRPGMRGGGASDPPSRVRGTRRRRPTREGRATITDGAQRRFSILVDESQP